MNTSPAPTEATESPCERLESERFIHIMDMSMKMNLTCGCVVPLNTLMAIMGQQIADGERAVCPFHKADHDFTDNKTLQYYAVIYLDHCLQGRSDFVTDFPPPPQ